ncbi:MAG: histidine kinase [Bacteroidetes bacterium]|nr:histidine kinase [Bacteroidota bacterium]
MNRQLRSHLLFYTLLGCFYLWPHNSLSQKADFTPIVWLSSENYKLEPGLSQNNINCILQDTKGTLWFGTWDGLNKYDGYKFTIYKPNLKNKEKGICHQTINALCEDHKNQIWIGTDGGLNVLEKGSQLFTYFSTSHPHFSLSNDTIRSIVEDVNHNIWIGTNYGLNVFHLDENRISVYFHDPSNPNSLPGNFIKQVYMDNENQIWVATNKGISVIDQSKGQFKSFRDGEFNLSGIAVNYMLQAKNGMYWFGTEQGLYAYQAGSGVFDLFNANPLDAESLAGNSISSIQEDHDENIWIGTNGSGVSIYNPSAKQFVNRDEWILREFRNDFIHCLFEDKSGIMWVGTSWTGLAKINPNANQFEHIYYSPNKPGGLNTATVWSLFEDEESSVLWIGTNNGINLLDLKTNTFSYIQHDPDKPNSLSDNLIRDVVKDDKGNFWIATFTGGLNYYNPKNNTFKSYLHNPNDKNSISSDQVWKVFIDQTGTIWVGTNYGLNKLDPTSGQFKRYLHDPTDPHSLSNNTIFSIYEDKSGCIWFCTYDGLNSYNPKQDNFNAIQYKAGQKGLSTKSVFSIYEDQDGIKWIATMGGGLNKFNPETGEFKVFTEDEGLPNNIVYRIFEDHFENLWMSTNRGISRFNKKTEVFVNFDIEDGIQSYEFNHNAACMNSEGVMYFGGMNGFNRFKPSNINKNDNIPPIVISSFRIFHEKQAREINDGDTIVLTYHQNFFSFEFSALEYSNPQKNKYQYRLKNYNKEWIKTDADRRIAEYTKVDPGTYIFQVKGSNSDGIWNENPISVTVIVKALWWQRWIFRIPVFLLILFIFFKMITIRLKQIQDKHKTEKQMLQYQKQFSDIQQKALRLQMNPHFIFNSLNSIQQFILQQDSETAQKYLSNFSSLMRKILENSKYDTIRLSEEIESIRLYLDLEELRFTNHFSYHIQLEKKINPSSILIPPMLVQPYLENAIWHGLMPKKSVGKLTIDISLDDHETLLVQVKDDGIGRLKAAEITSKRISHQSTGMKNIEERLELMNSLNQTNMRVEVNDLYLDNGKAAGTEVKLYIHFDGIKT